jgi:hypothetical protein
MPGEKERSRLLPTDIQPWLSDELPEPPSRDLLAELRAAFPKVWATNPNGTFRQAVTSTCDDNSAYGSVAMDRAYVAMCLYQAAEPGSLAEQANPAIINRKMTSVARPFGRDRATVALQRRDFEALQAAEEAPPAEPGSPDTRRPDEVNGSAE